MSAPILPLPFSTWAVKPMLGEPAYGYFNVLVEAELHTSARVYAQEIELNGRDIDPEEMLERLLLLPLACAHKDSLRRWTPIRDGTFHHIAGETLRQGHFSLAKRRFCRACLAESARHRVWWDLVHFHVCPLHSRELESTTKNGRQITWRWPSFAICPDGDDLRIPAPRRDDPDGFEHYVLQRFGVVAGEACPMLDDIALHEVLDLCQVVGRFLNNPRHSRAPRAGKDDCRSGFRALRATTDDLEACVEQWVVDRVSEHIRLRGYHNSLGWITNAAGLMSARSAAWPVIDLSLRRAFSRVGRMGRGHQGDRDLPHTEFTIKEVADQLGKDAVGLRVLAGKLGIEGARPTATGRALLSAKQTEELIEAVEDMISIRKAAEILGCSIVTVRRIAEHQMLNVFTESKLVGKEGGGAVVRKSAVLALLNRVEQIDAPVTTAWLRGFSHHAKKLELPEGELLARVLDGRIKVVGLATTSHGIGALRFPMPPSPKVILEPHADEIKMIEAMAASGFNYPEFHFIVENGFFGETHMRGNTKFLERKSFDEFHGRYVNARLFMDRLGASDRNLADVLATAGVTLAYRAMAPFPIYIVERTDLEAVIGGLSISGAPAIWEPLRMALKDSCPTLAVPENASGDRIRGYLSNRKTFIEFLFDVDAVIVSKTFSQRASREWDIFKRAAISIRKDWSMFTWSQDDPVRAEFRVASESDVSLAASSIAAYLSHFRYRPPPCGR